MLFLYVRELYYLKSNHTCGYKCININAVRFEHMIEFEAKISY
jgi:hypothetical protein